MNSPPGVRSERRITGRHWGALLWRAYLRGVNFSGAAFALAAQSSQQTTTTAPEGSLSSLPASLISQSQTGHFFVFIRVVPFDVLVLPDATCRPERMKPAPVRHSPTFRLVLISRRLRKGNLRHADGESPKAR